MSRPTRFALIVPAAGSGKRIGGEIPKQYVEILGEPVLRHTLNAFVELDGCVEVVIAIDETWKEEALRAADGMLQIRFVPGGSERQHSIANAIEALSSDPEVVLVHDAARPCASAELIDRVLRGAAEHGAAIPALPIPETVKLVDSDGAVVRTVSRDGLYTAQTPQGFRTELLRRAYNRALAAGWVGTDDASLVEELGEKVVIVEGEIGNIKITWPEDFRRVKERLRMSRTG